MSQPALRADPLIPMGPARLALAGVGLAFVAGVLLARDAPTGVAFLLAVVYAPLALIHPPVAIAIWIGLAFLSRYPVVSIGPNAATALALAAWVGTIGARRGLPSPWREWARLIPPLLTVLVAWLTLSALWARDSEEVFYKAWQWWVAAAMVAVVATTLRSRRDVQLAIAGFVGGAVVSVLIGLVGSGIAPSSAIDSATAVEGRLQGGAGDPNYLAAGVVPALVLGLALLQVSRGAVVRLALACALAILTVGLVATQSRGGFVGFAAAMLAALAVMRGRRAPIAALLVAALAFGGAWFAANPDALDLITADNAGNGRAELWEVAGRMTLDRPVTGVGLNNYRAVARDYSRDVGTLRFAALIAEKPHVVHNNYLQLAAETGIPGLLLFLAVWTAALVSVRQAARRFRALGDRAGATLADAVFVAQVASLVTSAFLSNATDWQPWFLLGLSPVLLLQATLSGRTGDQPV